MSPIGQWKILGLHREVKITKYDIYLFLFVTSVTSQNVSQNRYEVMEIFLIEHISKLES